MPVAGDSKDRGSGLAAVSTLTVVCATPPGDFTGLPALSPLPRLASFAFDHEIAVPTVSSTPAVPRQLELWLPPPEPAAELETRFEPKHASKRPLFALTVVDCLDRTLSVQTFPRRVLSVGPNWTTAALLRDNFGLGVCT